MVLTKDQIAQQQKQAEELLFSGPQTLGFAKGLFFGHFNAPLLFPYPDLKPEEQAEVDAGSSARCARFCDEHIDAAAIDRNADIPQSVIDGLGKLGVLGHDRAQGVRRPGLLAASQLQDHGSRSAATTPASPSSSTPTTASASAPCCCSAPRSSKRSGCPTWSAASSSPPSP